MKLKKDNVYKITVPIITNEELKRLDSALENDLDKIVQQITETVSKDKDIIFLQKVIKKQQKRNKKLKRKLNQTYGMIVKIQKEGPFNTGFDEGVKCVRDKIKELIKEKAKTDTYNFKTIAVKDIEKLLEYIEEFLRRVTNE